MATSGSEDWKRKAQKGQENIDMPIMLMEESKQRVTGRRPALGPDRLETPE